jgi:hypothetical protein
MREMLKENLTDGTEAEPETTGRHNYGDHPGSAKKRGSGVAAASASSWLR